MWNLRIFTCLKIPVLTTNNTVLFYYLLKNKLRCDLYATML